MYIKLVELVSHMLDQVGLKVQKYQSRSQMRIALKNGCETNRCLIGDRWSNDGSDSVIILIVTADPLFIDDHIMQDNANTHDQPESALKVRPVRDG
jgi:hypothetical protein